MEIDGVKIQPGDRILIKGQGRWYHRLWRWVLRKPQRPGNGIYQVESTTWKR